MLIFQVGWTEMGMKQDEPVSDTKAEPGGVVSSVTHVLLGIRSERRSMCLDLCSFDDLVLELYDSGLFHSKLVRKLGAAGSSWERLGAAGSGQHPLVQGRSCRPGGGDPLHQLHPSRPHICAGFPSRLLLVNLFWVRRGRRGFLPVPLNHCRAEIRTGGRRVEDPQLAPCAAAPLGLHPGHAGAAVPAPWHGLKGRGGLCFYKGSRWRRLLSEDFDEQHLGLLPHLVLDVSV